MTRAYDRGIVALISPDKQAKVRGLSGVSSDSRKRRQWTVMAVPPNKIRITVGAVQLDAELKSTKTAQEVYAALPVESPVNTWGEEFYFKMAGVKDHRETATNHVKVGDVAFWGAGQILAIFFGRTPMSMGQDPVPADRVNVIGRILGDASMLRCVMDVPTIRIERV
ncbi:MAG: cyclophilin-like fold protein [Nitrospiraceae bacterium]